MLLKILRNCKEIIGNRFVKIKQRTKTLFHIRILKQISLTDLTFVLIFLAVV